MSVPMGGTRKSPGSMPKKIPTPINKMPEENNMAQPQIRRAIECGVPDNKKYLHPLLAKNYGDWKYHDRPRPGVLHHVAHGGDQVWSVRAGTQRQMDVHTIRKLCDIADNFAEGRVRFTIRSNIEFMVSDEKKVAPLITELEKS